MAEAETDNDCSKVIAAVCYVNKTIGIACYDELSNTIFADSIPVCFEDMEDVLAKIKMATSPTLFLIHPTILSNLPLLDLIVCGIDNVPNTYRHTTVKSSSWNPQAALELMCTKLAIKTPQGSIPEGHDNRRSYLQLVASIDVERIQLKQSMGALLNYLRSNVLNMDDGMIVVSDVRQLDLVSYLRIDASSFRALQIFAQEQHPEVIKGVGRSKEGFSLFGLFDRTRSLPGRQCLRDWMLKPFCDKERITHRQDGIALVVRMSNRDFIGDMSKLLKKIHDIPRMLLRIKKVEATHIEWCRLYSSLEAALPILDLIAAFLNDTENREECDRDFLKTMLKDVNTQEPRIIFERLQCAIDFEASMETGATIMMDGYDSQLDHIRNIYDSLESFLTQAAHQVLEIVPLLQNISVEYVPQIGYLVAISEKDALLLQPYIKDATMSGTKRKRNDYSEQEREEDTNHDRNYDPNYNPNYGPNNDPNHDHNHDPNNDDGYGYGYEGQEGDRGDGRGDGREGRKGREGRENRSKGNGLLDFDDDQPYDGRFNEERIPVDSRESMERVNGEEDEEDEGFQFIYAQGGNCYYKHKIVTELDDTIGDIQSSITDRQRALLLEVEDGLLDAETPLQQLAAMLSRMDATISLGVIAAEMDFVRPEIVDESVIIIKEGRHLLQELTVEGAFVPNDTFINTDKNVALITGPNSSGKSVYLKQVGLLVYLAHIGSWLPCTKAVIGLTDRIMTRITSFETVAAAQSSFSLDLGQVSKMIKAHTPRTLCLIDEFGKGTTPVDGIALLATTIRHFTISKAKVVFVLHFTEVLHPQILDAISMQSINTFTMETHKPTLIGNATGDGSDHDFSDNDDGSGNSYSNNEPLPLFCLRLGVAPSSDGIACARNAGVTLSAIERALEVKQSILSHKPVRALATLDKNVMLGDIKHRELLSLFLRVRDWGPKTANKSSSSNNNNNCR